MTVIVIDITDEVRYRQEKEHHQRELEQKKKLESLGALAGGIAHQFNNILAVIMGYIEITLESPLRALDRGNLKKALESVRRASDLVKRILCFAQDQGKGERRIIDLSQIAKNTISLLQGTLLKNDYVIEDITDDVYVVGAKSQVEKILTDLVLNAKMAMPKGGKLTIELKKSDASNCQLRVRDEGVGIEEQIVHRIYDPFFTTRLTEGGTGLGLAEVYNIVSNMNGKIEVNSKVGQGTEFIINLPRVNPQWVSPVSHPTQKLYFGLAMVIDDEYLLTDVGVMVLDRFGFTAKGFTCSDQASDYYYQHASDVRLILMDYSMPNKPGTDLAREFKQVNREVKILLVTGFADMLGNGTPDWLDGVLSKPYSQKELKNKLNKLKL